ncbi:restriction endonuclease [Paenibacillus thiaminolyticus]|uniref:nSTAND3 domain-containing NTPase n=1 Tax=Paenibacillus thiaminolyticus TaxID=49283 RepID=UPI002350AFAE|nr:restriction endonuclease [Paenibacillus thiaminolyticus]WCR27524.1 restriction endonuclease [Paenibacillus thiaminolyticus]
MPPNYDFHNCLSPREFEELARDILEIKEKVPFEISGRGKDGGVDLRYWEGTTKIIVQVKCYQNNYSQLLNVLKKEKQKARALEPTRYILVTSIKLQIHARDEIFNLFDGLIRNRDDIIDRDDLNKLLGYEQYQHVERTHYKLWLSSTVVLTSLIEEIVHRGIRAESRGELEEIEKTVKFFVQNPNFGRGIDILEKFRYVLISGEPGIGKTTLGRCLAAYFLHHMGYREFIYADTVGADLSMYKEKERQVFFFDDFWGSMFKDEKLPHNEEKHLLKFIQRISNSHNKILILTSREYVLQQGLAKYQDEQLKQIFDIGRCFLQLEDYSDLIKTKILFNHLYFSRLEWDYVKVIADGYERIINHSNYNPRIIETFLDKGIVLLKDSSPLEYYQEFLNSLNEPLSFWKSIFMKQTYGAQLTALILFLSSQPMRLSDLKDSYYSCIEAGGKSNEQIQDLEFDSIVAQLEKTMIKTYYQNATSTILVKFQNPSIKDFLYWHLADNIRHYGKMLIQGCPFLNQLLFMFKATNAVRRINDDSEEDFFSKKKIRLPKKLEDLLSDKIISEFEILKYSYAAREVFEHKPSVYVDPEDCIVGKLQDILFNFGTNENANMDVFIENKVQYLCSSLHEDEYPLSYDDMVEFPYLIKAAIPLKINLDGNLLINDYYKRSRFAEHLLMLNNFEEIFPKEFADFKKINYKSIKRNIRFVLLEDVDFFASDGEYDRIAYLIDMIYPEILENYKLRDSKSFRKELWRAADYSNDEDDENNKRWLELIESNKEKIGNEEENERQIEELMKAERDALLGVTKEMLDDEDIIDFIQKNTQTATEASELIFLLENEEPWYIGPFLSNLDRLSLLLTFFHEEKKLPQTSASFFEKFAFYLIHQYCDRASISDSNPIVEMFSEFAFDMMRRGEIVFSEQTVKNHSAFKDKLETDQIDLATLLSCPFLVQRGKWYEFQTLAFHSYLSLKKFLCHSEKERNVSYIDFLNLRDSFVDIEHDIWILCSELDLHNFNQYYLFPILKDYLVAIDTTNPKTVCSSTLSFLELTLDFKISQDTLLPHFPGSCCDGLKISALQFIDHDLLEVKFYMSCSEEEERKKNHSDLLRLGQFITQQGFSIGHDEYELDLVKHSANTELLDILESLGVCDFLWNSYHQVLEIVEKTMTNNYSFRLDSYGHDPKIRRFALVD